MNTSLSYFFPFCLHLLCGFLPPCPYLIVSRVSSIQEAQACSGHVKNEVILCFAAMLAASGFSCFKFPGVNDGTDLSLWVFLWCLFVQKQDWWQDLWDFFSYFICFWHAFVESTWQDLLLFSLLPVSYHAISAVIVIFCSVPEWTAELH